MTKKYTPKKVARSGAASILGLGMALTMGLPAANSLTDADLFHDATQTINE